MIKKNKSLNNNNNPKVKSANILEKSKIIHESKHDEYLKLDEKQIIVSKTNIRIKIPNLIWIIAGLSGLIFFILYLYSASTNNVGYAYSDELMATAYNLGLTRPPGYVLYTLLLHFILNLPIPVSIALRGHALSALLQSISLAIYFVSSWLLIEYLGRNRPQLISKVFSVAKDSILISFIATAMIGSIPLIWIYGSIAEVPAFINLLLSLICLLSFSLIMGTGNKVKTTQILVMLFAIAIANKPMLFILLPSIYISLKLSGIKLHYKEIGKQIIIFISIISLSLVLINVLSSLGNDLSWNIKPGILGYWSYFKDNNFNENPFWQMVGKNILDTLPMYFKVLEKNLGWFFIGLVLIGLRVLFVANRKIFGTLILITGVLAVMFPISLSWSSDRFTQVLILRQYSMVMGLFIFPLAVGLWIFFSRLNAAIQVLSPKVRLIKIGIICLGTGIIISRITPLIKEYHFANLKSFTAIHAQILRSIPTNAVLVCKDDLSCASLLYSQKVIGLQRGVAIVPTQYPLNSKYLEVKKLRGFNYKQNPYIIFDYVSWNIGKRPLYMAGATQTMFDILGMPYGFAYYVPNGYSGEVVKNLPSKLSILENDMSNKLKDEVFKDDDIMFNLQKDNISQYHMFNALVYEKMGQKSKAREQLNIGTNLLYDMPDSIDDSIEGYRLAIESLSPVDSWVLGSKSQDISEVMSNVEKSIELKKLNTAYVGAMGAVVIKPDDVKARLLLAKVYELREQYSSAILEYNNVLIIDPGNKTAIQKIETLDSK